MKQLHIVDHPLIQHKLALLRDKNTHQKEFTELVHELTFLLGYEATRDLKLDDITIETPLESCEAKTLSDKHPIIVPILRAGLGMVQPLQTLIQTAKVGHIGLFRDEATRQPQQYYFKLPENCQDKQFYVCVPMLATGGSAEATFDRLKEEGITKICFIGIVASPEGIERIKKSHPDIPIYIASLDRQLNDRAFILPGLGDAGDRIFGTRSE